MGVGVADAAGGDTDQNIGWVDLWQRDFAFFQLCAKPRQSYRFHRSGFRIWKFKQTPNIERRTKASRSLA